MCLDANRLIITFRDIFVDKRVKSKDLETLDKPETLDCNQSRSNQNRGRINFHRPPRLWYWFTERIRIGLNGRKPAGDSSITETYRADLGVTCNRAEIANLSFDSLSRRAEYSRARAGARRFLRILFGDFCIAGNKILLSAITNGVPRAVKIPRGTRNRLYPEGFCIKRASIRENYCARTSGGFVRRECVRLRRPQIRSSVALTK